MTRSAPAAAGVRALPIYCTQPARARPTLGQRVPGVVTGIPQFFPEKQFGA
jgi:hypothetical protein